LFAPHLPPDSSSSTQVYQTIFLFISGFHSVIISFINDITFDANHVNRPLVWNWPVAQNVDY